MVGDPGGVVSRRALLKAMAVLAPAIALSGQRALGAQFAESLTIDLAVEPASLDPATTYDVNGWSVIHAIYDSLVQYGDDGSLEMLLAESLVQTDPLTWMVKLREGIQFHNGEPVNVDALAFSIAHIVDPATASQIAGNFSIISEVAEIDELTAELRLTAPAPWLPAQIAAWLVLLPPVHGATGALLDQPVGTGPYQFTSWTPGESIELARNPDYFGGSVKGAPIADEVQFRFVTEASTRVADLLSGSSDIVRNIQPVDVPVVTGEDAEVIAVDVSGSAWVRIPTDVEPFSRIQVRQALNLAVDADAIISTLLGGHGQRLANLFVPGGLGYDDTLAPWQYDPERAKALLEQQGMPDGFETTLDYATTEDENIVQAIVGQLEVAGIRVKATPRELAVFNSGDWWLGTDPEAAPLRFATWRPLFDPHTLLSLVFSAEGFLSRHNNLKAQPLIDAMAIETDPVKRAEIAIDLGGVLHEEPAAIYLYSLSTLFGAAADAPDWTPRADDYLIPALRT